MTKRYINRKDPIQVLIIFCLLAIILRFFSFFPSVIDHDESTYLEIARMLLSGKVLYVDMVDIKPPGIFVILAFFQFIFGHSIFVMRLLSALWIGMTAFMIFRTVRLLVKDDTAPFAAGIIYIFLISTWSFYGISLTPEIYFNLFTITALYILLKKKKGLNFLLSGLVAGLGFLVKYFVLFDFAAFLLFIAIMDYKTDNKLNVKKVLLNNFLAGIGFVIPFAAVNYYYYRTGHFAEFYNIVYLAPGKYPSPFDPWKMLKFILEFHLLFFPVFFMFYYVLFDKKNPGIDIKPAKFLIFIWSLASLVAVVLAGKTFGHYTIQLMLPVSIAAGLFFRENMTYPGFVKFITDKKNGRILLVVIIVAITLMKLEYIIRRDIPREIAAYLKPKLAEDDAIYAGNYHHILYYLLEKDSPTKYVHRSLLLSEKHIKALDINTDEEFDKIMAARPAYIVVEKQYPVARMRDFIAGNYELEKDFGNGIFLFRLKKL